MVNVIDPSIMDAEIKFHRVIPIVINGIKSLALRLKILDQRNPTPNE
jgi:hypothetical protein